MAKNSAVNLDITPNADGYSIAGGTTPRTLTLTAGNVTLSAGGANTYTMPAATDTLVGRASTDTLTNKTLTTPVVDQFNSASGVGAAWISSTPTITAGSGTFTSVSCQAYYQQFGKMVIYNGLISITTNGTAASGIYVPLPVTAARITSGPLHGREINATGRGVTGVMDTTTRCYMTFSSDNSYPGANGRAISFSVMYEAA